MNQAKLDVIIQKFMHLYITLHMYNILYHMYPGTTEVRRRGDKIVKCPVCMTSWDHVTSLPIMHSLDNQASRTASSDFVDANTKEQLVIWLLYFLLNVLGVVIKLLTL